MLNLDVFYPEKVLKILAPGARMDEIPLSLTSDVTLSMSQSPVTFPVTKVFGYLYGITKDSKVINIAGLVVDDKKWERLVGVNVQKSLFKQSLRVQIAEGLEFLYDNSILVTVQDEMIGTRKNLLITNLAQSQSSTYENATEWQITLVELKLITGLNAVGGRDDRNTVDPYQYYEYGGRK